MLLFYRTDVSLEFLMYQHFGFFHVVPRFHWKVQGLFCIFCFLKIFHGLQIVTWTWSHDAVVDSLILCHWWYICLVQDVFKGYLNLLVMWFKIRRQAQDPCPIKDLVCRRFPGMVSDVLGHHKVEVCLQFSLLSWTESFGFWCFV